MRSNSQRDRGRRRSSSVAPDAPGTPPFPSTERSRPVSASSSAAPPSPSSPTFPIYILDHPRDRSRRRSSSSVPPDSPRSPTFPSTWTNLTLTPTISRVQPLEVLPEEDEASRSATLSGPSPSSSSSSSAASSISFKKTNWATSALTSIEEPENHVHFAPGAQAQRRWSSGLRALESARPQTKSEEQRRWSFTAGTASPQRPSPADVVLPQGRRGSVMMMVNAGRRASATVRNALRSVDPIHTRDNPLGLGINEIVLVRSSSYTPWSDFNARRFSQAPPGPISISVERPGMSEDEQEYAIQRIAKHDDMELMKPWKRWAYRLSGPLAIITIAMHIVYFALRVIYTRRAELAAQRTYWMAWAFIVVEIIVLLPMLLHRLWGLHAIGMRQRPKLRIIGDNVPSVDVVITCCGEDDDLVLDTAKAACNVDYPLSRFRVIICDDGNSATLRAKTERTAVELFDNLYYRSRPKFPGVPHHFKAGNLNYALDETQRLPGGAANFFAALDADMIPEKDWLRALIPHMIQDPNCSMACPPQLFYNVPKDDPLCQSLDLFVHVSEPMKDTLGVAWCTGSGYVMRRAALEAIGRFPTGSLAEDVCTSSMLLGNGWNTAFVHEPLQFGTVPDSLSSHLKQRTRWTIGTVQTSIKLRFCLWGPLVKRMTFFQRLCGFVYTISSLLTVALVASMFTSPVVLISGGNLVPYSNYEQLQWLIRAWFASHIINRINELITYLPSGYLTGQREARAVLWMAIFQSISIVRTFVLPSWLGGKVAVFTSSGSQKAELDERDARRRAPLWRRLKVTIWDCQCYLHLLYIGFTIAAVVLGTYWNFRAGGTVKDRLVGVLTHAGWPPVLWLSCILSCWTPIAYAISPPNCPDREDLLVRDGKTGVAYPREESKRTQTGWGAWAHEIHYSLITAYTVVIFALSFRLQ